VAEAQADLYSRKAMDEELGAIEKNRTWELVEQLPRSQKAIGLKWVYKVKRDKKGAIVKHKALLVAKSKHLRSHHRVVYPAPA
jgi:hypothetical protein